MTSKAQSTYDPLEPNEKPRDFKSLARKRLFVIIGLVFVIAGLLAGLIYLEVAKPIMDHNNSA